MSGHATSPSVALKTRLLLSNSSCHRSILEVIANRIFRRTVICLACSNAASLFLALRVAITDLRVATEHLGATSTFNLSQRSRWDLFDVRSRLGAYISSYRDLDPATHLEVCHDTYAASDISDFA